MSKSSGDLTLERYIALYQSLKSESSWWDGPSACHEPIALTLLVFPWSVEDTVESVIRAEARFFDAEHFTTLGLIPRLPRYLRLPLAAMLLQSGAEPSQFWSDFLVQRQHLPKLGFWQKLSHEALGFLIWVIYHGRSPLTPQVGQRIQRAYEILAHHQEELTEPNDMAAVMMLLEREESPERAIERVLQLFNQLEAQKLGRGEALQVACFLLALHGDEGLVLAEQIPLLQEAFLARGESDAVSEVDGLALLAVLSQDRDSVVEEVLRLRRSLLDENSSLLGEGASFRTSCALVTHAWSPSARGEVLHPLEFNALHWTLQSLDLQLSWS